MVETMSAYLTFDDGPMYPNTERVFEILADLEVAATFFMVGQNVDANPQLAARVVREGHAVGNHSYSHPDLTTLNQQAASNEIGLTQRAIWNATGVWPTIMRPPYGSSNQSVDQLIENWDQRKVLCGTSVRQSSTTHTTFSYPGGAVQCADFSVIGNLITS
jgi:peptidoglycan/xylan/chitin deacetylase (PgdA/CDA1 family)